MFIVKLIISESPNFPDVSSLPFRAPDEILGVPGPKKSWMPWRMTQKQVFRKTSLANYDFKKSRGGGMAPCPSFIGGPAFIFIYKVFRVFIYVWNNWFSFASTGYRGFTTRYIFHIIFLAIVFDASFFCTTPLILNLT